MPLPSASAPERLLRGVFALLALVLLLVAVWVSVARALLPLLNEYRPELESALRSHLGRDVRIGHITGRWEGLSAHLVVRDIEIRDGEHLIYLENLSVIPDVWSSLHSGALRVSRVALEGLQLGIRQNADGNWQLKGMGNTSSTPDAAPLDPAAVWQTVAMFQEMQLVDARLTVEPWQRPAFALNDIDAQLNVHADALQLHSRWRLPDGQPASLRVDVDDARRWPQTRVQVYAELPNADWLPWLPPLVLPEGGEMTRLNAGGQLWLTWADGHLQRAVTRVAVPALTINLREAHQSTAFNDLQGTAWLARTTEGVWTLQTSDIEGQFAGRSLGLGAMRVEYTRPDAPWTLHLAHIDLAPLSQMVMQLAPLPPLAHDIVATLAPQGVLESARIQVQPRANALPEADYHVRLTRVGTQAWGGVPAFANISGELTGNLHGGELRLDTQDFMLHLPRLFPEAWHYRTAQARLQWQLDARAFTLSSRLMRLSGEEGELAGNMLIRLFHDAAAESYMDLQVGLQHGSALYTPRYLPTRLAGFSPSLATWLQQAIRGGQVEQGMFIYQGALSAQRPDTARALALYFNVNEAALDYQAEWPPLSQIRGEVFVEDERIRVLAPSARAWNSQLENVEVQLDRRRNPMKLQVNGRIRSDVVDGLRILQDTPLGREKTFATWKGEGALQGDLQLEIPLEGKEDVRARVGFAADNARLQLSNPALDIQAIQGRFVYDTERGLSSNDLKAQLWGHAVRARLQASGRPGKPRSQLTAEGSTDVARLANWLGAPDGLPVSGRLPYRLALDVQGDERWLTVKSSLQGVAVDLPAPLGKLASETRDSQWQMNFTGREQVYRFNQPNVMSMDMALPMGARLERARAEWRFGTQTATAPSEPGWRLVGEVARLDVGAWRTVIDKWMTSKGNTSKGVALHTVNINVREVILGSLTFRALAMQLNTQSTGVGISLDGPELKGQLTIPNQKSAPWTLHLQRVHLPSRVGNTADPDATPDPLASVNPRLLPALDVRVDNLWQGTDRLGRWQFQMRPSANGATFNGLNLELRGLTVGGTLEWQGARTTYKGVLYGENVSDILLAWGFAPSISSENFRVTVDGGWPGSPAQAGLRQFSGSLDIRARNGQVAAVESGALRVFGIFNFDALRRRLRFDFSDLFGKGLAYDRIDGRLQGTDGVFLTDKPFTLEGPSTRLELEGQLDAVNEHMASRLRVALPLSNNLPVAALLAGALPIAGALLIVDRLVGDQISKVASVEYRVDGPWQNPQISPFGKPSSSPDSEALE